jgi:hypothetical protein
MEAIRHLCTLQRDATSVEGDETVPHLKLRAAKISRQVLPLPCRLTPSTKWKAECP